MTNLIDLAVSLTESGFLFNPFHFTVFAIILAVPIVLFTVIIVKRVREGIKLKQHRLERTRLQQERDKKLAEQAQRDDG